MEDNDIGKYELWLEGAGSRNPELIRALRRLRPELTTPELLALIRAAPCWLRDDKSYEEVMSYRRRLEEAGAVATVIPQRRYFPYMEERSFEALDDILNDAYSAGMRVLGELPLRDWVDQLSLPTAFRFLYFPSFHPAVVVAAWPQAGSDVWHVTAATGACPQHRADSEVLRVAWQLSQEETTLITAAIEESRFWECVWSEVFYSSDVLTGCMLDGAHWLFEGWRYGNYRFQQVQSPGSDPSTQVPERLGLAFFALLGERLGPQEIY